METVHRADTWVEIPTNISISELTLLNNVSNTPGNKIVLEDARLGETLTYEDLRIRVRRLAYWLRHEAGLRQGHVVTIICPSCIEYVEIVHACWWIGAVISPVNYRLHPDELKKVLALVRPQHIIIHDSLQSTGDTLRSQFSAFRSPPQCISFGATRPGFAKLSLPSLRNGNSPELPFEPLLQRDSRDVPAAIMLSSGTSGIPKAVILSHYNLVASCIQLRAGKPQNWRGDQKEIVFLPVAHIYGTYVTVTMSAWLGSYVCIMERFDLEQFCKLMQDRRATLARIVPAIAKALAEDPIVRKYRYDALEYFTSGGAPVPEDIAAALQARFPHVELCQTYGCTELSGAISQSGRGDSRGSGPTAGHLIANVEVRIVSEDGKDLPISSRQPGELWIRTPSRMMGYKGPHAIVTDDCLDEGWYRTGDLGYVNGSGSVVIVDRLKDVFKYKGFQIAPAELEEVLLGHPDVHEVAVCGIADPKEATDVPVAFVVPQDPAKASADIVESITSYLSSRVAKYKQVKRVVILKELPRNSLGKVVKRELRLIIPAHVARNAAGNHKL